MVRVQEADPAVDRHRRRHTPSGSQGMPAHITLLYPFTPQGRPPAETAEELRDLLRGFPAFEYAIRRLARFAGSPQVLYGVPEPDQPFIALIQALSRRFGVLPYGGEHADVVPHLTVATSGDAALIASIESEVTPALPIRASADHAEVWNLIAGRWRPFDRMALGSDTAA